MKKLLLFAVLILAAPSFVACDGEEEVKDAFESNDLIGMWRLVKTVYVAENQTDYDDLFTLSFRPGGEGSWDNGGYASGYFDYYLFGSSLVIDRGNGGFEEYQVERLTSKELVLSWVEYGPEVYGPVKEYYERVF